MNLLVPRWAAACACLVLSAVTLRGQNPSAPAPPAARATVLQMADFTRRTSDADAAFAEALAAVHEAAAQEGTPPAGASPRVILALDPGAIYKIKRPIEVGGLADCEIDGHGAKIVNATLGTSLHLKPCRHVTVRDLSIGYDPLPFTQGTITAFDKTGRQVTVKVDRGYPEEPGFLATIHDAYLCVMNRQTHALKAGARTFLSPERVCARPRACSTSIWPGARTNAGRGSCPSRSATR